MHTDTLGLEKKAVYGNAPYTLTRQVASAAKWNHDAIAKRQGVLADLALTAWPL